MTGTTTPELSIVIPCYNEEENVVAIHAAVKAEAQKHAQSHEIIFIDNFSSDRTRELLREICVSDPETRAIFNNRNYGQMRSPTHAIYQATGRAVVGMCADFQDPPAMIGPFLEQWRAGAQVVLGQRRVEEKAGLMTAIRYTGYRLLGAISDYPIVRNATGFGLFDRAVVDSVSRWNEPEPFFRGMVVESGYRLAVLPFDRPARAAGETKNNWRTLTAFALSGLTGSARSLLRAPLYLVLPGIMITFLCALGALGALILGRAGWVWLLLGALQFGLASMMLLFMGLLGDQVRLIAERTRNTPLVIEQERINFPSGRSEPSR
jgi:polyisoprenyl-phosphate glycosyltransferase